MLRLLIRLALPAPADTPVLVLVRSEGSALGLVLARPATGSGPFEIPLPDDSGLAGRRLQLRARIQDPATGIVRWSSEREIVLEP